VVALERGDVADPATIRGLHIDVGFRIIDRSLVMSITRRKLLGLLPAISAAFIPALRAKAKPARSSRSVLGYELHDDVSVSLLKRYARSLALKDEKVRWEAQRMFHEAQLARRGGGTLGHKLGYRHQDFVEAHE
jgi:hypothetical protein